MIVRFFNAIWLDIIVFNFFFDGGDVSLLAELGLPELELQFIHLTCNSHEVVDENFDRVGRLQHVVGTPVKRQKGRCLILALLLIHCGECFEKYTSWLVMPQRCGYRLDSLAIVRSPADNSIAGLNNLDNHEAALRAC